MQYVSNVRRGWEKGRENYTKIMHLIKGICAGNIQWDSNRKAPTTCRNFYEVGGGLRIVTICTTDESKLLAANFPTRRPRFVKYMRGTKMRMVIISKRGFRISTSTFPELQRTWEQEWTSLGSTKMEKVA